MTSRPCQVGSTLVTRVSQIFVQAKKPGNEFVREPCSNNLLDKFICSCRRRNKFEKSKHDRGDSGDIHDNKARALSRE